MITNDLYCPSCGGERKDVWFHVEEIPYCSCGTPMRQDWSHGKAPATDLHSPRYFEGIESRFSSTRQAERSAQRRARQWSNEMQERGIPVTWSIDGVAGDKQGGAREVRRRKNSAFSYRGQRTRISTGERASRSR